MDKTGNSWDNKKNFQKKPGKYQLVEIDYDNDDDDEEKKPNKSVLVLLVSIFTY
jgi:hypothetical protein